MILALPLQPNSRAAKFFSFPESCNVQCHKYISLRRGQDQQRLIA